MNFSVEKREIGSVLMLVDLGTLFQPLGGIATAIDSDATHADSGLPFYRFIGGICLVKLGILSVAAG